MTHLCKIESRSAPTRITSTKRFTNLKVNLERLGLYIGAIEVQKCSLFLMNLNILSVHHDFLGSEGLQGTHIDALNPFSSKLMTLALRGGLWTFLRNLALCAAVRCIRFYADFQGIHSMEFTHLLHWFHHTVHLIRCYTTFESKLHNCPLASLNIILE